MMTEIMLVEGVSDVQLISYYLQKVYSWNYEYHNRLGIIPLDAQEHIETLSKGENQLILCGVGGNGKFAHFVEMHRVNDMILLQDISSLMVVTDRDEASNAGIARRINQSLPGICMKSGQWYSNTFTDTFGQLRTMSTFLLIIPTKEKGALERVIINALQDIPEEKALIQEVVQFVDTLKEKITPELQKTNKANKATVGTFFSVRDPQHAMRSFSVFISKIDWEKSSSLHTLFLPFADLGKEKDKGTTELP